VRAGDFDVTITDHITGQQVFDIATDGLRALGADGTAGWHALRVRATNISTRPAFFSFSAIHLADFDGEAWDHMMILTPPIPAAAKEILPGAIRDGWAAFEEQPWSEMNLLRIQPSIVADKPRFVTFGNTPDNTSGPENDASTPAFAPGDIVRLTEDRVNLRDDASISSDDIIVELEIDTEMTITGDAVDADGYTWYPVEVLDTGEAGYV